MIAFPHLTLLTLTPILGALLLLTGFANSPRTASRIGRFFSSMALLQGIALWHGFKSDGLGMQFMEEHRWIPSLQVHYVLGVDGLGLLMVLLTCVVVPIAQSLATDQSQRPALFHALVLLLQSGLLGVFTSLNFFHWFLFWELSLIPSYFLIKLWGGPRRVEAATQFFLYTLVGSIALLLAFQVIYLATETFDFQVLAAMGLSGDLARELERMDLGPCTGREVLIMVFAGVLLGFAIKVPLIPFHTWLPDAYAEAPTSVTILLTGAMSKMGLYGFLRILLPLFPGAMREFSDVLLVLAVLTVAASAWAAMAQKDMKRLLAYSSINHLGYCLLAIFAAAGSSARPGAFADRTISLTGTLLQMFNHSIIAAAAFCLVGLIERRSGGQRGLDDFGGLRRIAPVFAGFMGIVLFASMGLPGLGGFVGEFLIFRGVFSLAPWAAAIAALGLLLTAVFLLTFMLRVFHGPLNPRWAGFSDLSRQERVSLAPVLFLIVLLGVWPQTVVGMFSATVQNLALWFSR